MAFAYAFATDRFFFLSKNCSSSVECDSAVVDEALPCTVVVTASKFFFQLNDGEQLYASILPGNLAWMASANSFANSRSGLPVSHQIRSAYGAYARPRDTA